MADHPLDFMALAEHLAKINAGRPTIERESDGAIFISRDVAIEAMQALAALQADPEYLAGWKLVPVEPTEAMTKAGFDPFIASHDPFFNRNEPTAPIYRAMLRAAPAAPPPEYLSGQEAVKVKPLEWRESMAVLGYYSAESAFGDYSVNRDEDDGIAATPWCCWSPADDGTNLGHFASLSEAEAAGNADYQNRILSAIATPDLKAEKAEVRNEVMRDVLTRIVKCDDDAKAAHGLAGAGLNGVGLVDLFDHVGHPFGVGEHKQQPYRSVELDVALIDARAALNPGAPK